MNTIENIKEQYRQTQATNGTSLLTPVEQKAFETFNQLGIPTVRNEEWKYTRIGGLFNKDFKLAVAADALSQKDLETFFLPGHEEANVLFFINGIFSKDFSNIRSAEIEVMSLEEAANSQHSNTVATHLGHSSKYIKDGIHALNTAFIKEGVFVYVKKGKVVEHPVYIYHITDARTVNVLSQPRTLVHVDAAAQVQFVQQYVTLGTAESFTNGVIEVVVEQDAMVENYTIQADAAHTSQVTTTHFRQVGKSYVHTVTITLDGAMVRNNLNIVMEAEHAEALLHGLYILKGKTHVDNHTVVDNRKPHLLSNELYKGVMDDEATAVFNGKIFVQPDAQKINAFQSNKNILLSDAASVNTKPQLEIFADDVKCSHGCTVGQLDEEGMFYLQSRGISKEMAKALQVHAFAIDILTHIKLEPIRKYVDALISERLQLQ